MPRAMRATYSGAQVERVGGQDGVCRVAGAAGAGGGGIIAPVRRAGAQARLTLRREAL